MKERITAVFLLLLAALTIWAITKQTPDAKSAYGTILPRDSSEQETHSPAVASEVIRLHILADSDEAADQDIKLAVRDALLPYLHAATITAASREEALALLEQHCDTFTAVVNQTLQSLGAGYTGSVALTCVYFPLRIYGSQTYLSADAVLFPPGLYDSIQVVLGEGNGHNWWCLAYPSLCFIDASYDYVPKDSIPYDKAFADVKAKTLERLFGQAIDSDEEITVTFDSKLWHLLRHLLQKD